MSLGMGNYRHFHKSISRYLSITTHTPPKTTGVVTTYGLSEMPLSTTKYTTNICSCENLHENQRFAN